MDTVKVANVAYLKTYYSLHGPDGMWLRLDYASCHNSFHCAVKFPDSQVNPADFCAKMIAFKN